MLLEEIEEHDLQLSSAAQMYGVMMWHFTWTVTNDSLVTCQMLPIHDSQLFVIIL